MTKHTQSIFVVFIFLGALFSSSSLLAATWMVPGDAATIQEGIDAAAAGDTVLVACGTYMEFDIAMKAGIVLRGATDDPSCVVIDAENFGRVLDCDNLTELSTIENITFTGGFVTEGWFEALGGGVRCLNSEVAITNCAFEGNMARIGAGLGASESTLTLMNCSFTSNTASHVEWAAGGAVWARDCFGTIENCQVTSNSAFSDDTEFPGDGGGFFFNNNRLDVSNCLFEGNSTGAGAGGMYSVSNDSSIFSSCDFLGNSAANGGAVYFEYGAAAQLLNCNFIGNTALAGGAMVTFNESYPRLVDCLFEYNTATQWGGGALDSWSSTVEIDGCTFRNNSSNTYGGGANFGGSTATISNTVFQSNDALTNGGGIHCNYASVTATNCTLVDNEAVNGAGLYCGVSSYATVENTIIAFSTGGASMVGLEEGFATISCSDFYGNLDGDWVGDFADQLGMNGNFSADPVFCDLGLGDFSLDHISPCALENQSECGQVGAQGIGCWLSATPDEAKLPFVISDVGNYPNPFNPSTTIRFSLNQAGHTRVLIFDVAGHLIRTLIDSELPAQTHQVSWHGQNDRGREVAAGVYFYRISSGDSQTTGRMALVK